MGLNDLRSFRTNSTCLSGGGLKLCPLGLQGDKGVNPVKVVLKCKQLK